MAKKGRPLSEEQRSKIVMLLRTTDMSTAEIALRMDCSRTAVAKVNRQFQVRNFEGRRSSWSVEGESVDEA